MKTLSQNEQFQESVLREVNAVEEKFQAVERNQETLLRNYEQLGRETKQTMEEMTRLKNSANDRAQILARGAEAAAAVAERGGGGGDGPDPAHRQRPGEAGAAESGGAPGGGAERGPAPRRASRWRGPSGKTRGKARR